MGLVVLSLRGWGYKPSQAPLMYLPQNVICLCQTQLSYVVALEENY